MMPRSENINYMKNSEIVMAKGKFITLEGVEGAGKSTAMNFIEQHLTAKEIDFIVTREPGGTIIAEDIRKIILDHYPEPMCPYTELLLYFASRAQHITQVIQPALDAGRWVVSDRFTDASYAYQGIGRNIPEQNIAVLEQMVQGDLRPDLTIVLDVEAEIGLARVKKVSALDRIESEDISFFHKVRDYYLRRVKENAQKYKLVDASQDIDSVKQQIHKILAAFE